MIDFNEDDMRNILLYIKEKRVNILTEDIDSNKTKSELISNIFSYAIRQYYTGVGYNIDVAVSDNDSDLQFNDFDKWPVEVKVARLPKSGKPYWRGGSYSNRPGQYILSLWDLKNDELYFFVSSVILDNDDWILPPIPDKGKKPNYYATTFSLETLISKKRVDIIGEARFNINKPFVKMETVIDVAIESTKKLTHNGIVPTTFKNEKDKELLNNFFDFQS